MIAGYVRLSRDDDGKNYSSIENQKLIIEQYARTHNMSIDRWYEDDGVSGYLFERPAFSRLIHDLDCGIDTVLAKDFSRIGRHNAKVLLLLDEFMERGKRLIVIDDNYDSAEPDDDVIGIKTWYNEKYVKDTSRKIKSAMGARQKEGTLLVRVPFGYKRNEEVKQKIEIVPREAETVRLIFELYLHGDGYRKIAGFLSSQGITTPSMSVWERELEAGKDLKRPVSGSWSDGMVKAILDNDFYTGTLRLHKRERKTVHGKDKRVAREEQIKFEHHHVPVIEEQVFELVQEIKEKRTVCNYRGNRDRGSAFEVLNPFGGCLFCQSCHKRLTQVMRHTKASVRKYYICNTYHTKGKAFCAKSHLIEEKQLMDDLLNCLRLYRMIYYDKLASCGIAVLRRPEAILHEKKESVRKEIADVKKQLKTLAAQEIKILSVDPADADIMSESYTSLKADLLFRIHKLEEKLQEPEQGAETESADQSRTMLDILDRILEKGELTRKDMETVVERITVDENGYPFIEFR